MAHCKCARRRETEEEGGSVKRRSGHSCQRPCRGLRHPRLRPAQRGQVPCPGHKTAHFLRFWAPTVSPNQWEPTRHPGRISEFPNSGLLHGENRHLFWGNRWKVTTEQLLPNTIHVKTQHLITWVQNFIKTDTVKPGSGPHQQGILPRGWRKQSSPALLAPSVHSRQAEPHLPHRPSGACRSPTGQGCQLPAEHARLPARGRGRPFQLSAVQLTAVRGTWHTVRFCALLALGELLLNPVTGHRQGVAGLGQTAWQDGEWRVRSHLYWQKRIPCTEQSFKLYSLRRSPSLKQHWPRRLAHHSHHATASTPWECAPSVELPPGWGTPILNIWKIDTLSQENFIKASKWDMKGNEWLFPRIFSQLRSISPFQFLGRTED